MHSFRITAQLHTAERASLVRLDDGVMVASLWGKPRY